MSTLEYLDENGSVTNFTFVPWTVIHDWLSFLNGNPNIEETRAKGVNRGKILEELEARRKGTESVFFGGALRLGGRDRGYGRDWREYENAQGYTHLEELLIYQPKEWRKQAREYLFRFNCDLNRVSDNAEDRRTISMTLGGVDCRLVLENPISVVLFHGDLERTSRYAPLNFLLAYGASDPLPKMTMNMVDEQIKELHDDVSPLDYFLDFQGFVVGYQLEMLRKIGKQSSCRRLCLIKELDFSDIIGQRLAKQRICQAMVNHVWNRNEKGQICKNVQPLSMIFAGPSGNGKTELAMWLAKLMNKPGDDDFFVKVDCGKLSDANELFGMSGPYQGAKEGSALNNFVRCMSAEPDALGIVLLDEIEKSDQSVIHGLYQVIDKGEWTNKQLGRGLQTETISCHNLVFIMTTNACDSDIQKFAVTHEDIYTLVGDDLEDLVDDLEGRLRNALRYHYPFTDAFVGRIGRIVPFLPMANGDPETEHPLLGESMTVAKLLIERQQEKYASASSANIQQLMTAKTKHRMARIIVRDAIPEAGVRSLQKLVETKMGDRMVHSLLLEQGGISEGSKVEYFAKEEEKRIDFRIKDRGNGDVVESDKESDSEDESVEESDNEDAYG